MKQKSKDRKFNFNSTGAHLVWGGLAACAWVGEQFWHAQKGMPFSAGLFFKGLLILFLATLVFRAGARKSNSFLGMFPLLWLAISRFQWDLCADSNYRYSFWLIVFLISEYLLLKLSDGKKLLMILTPLWAALSWLFPFSFLLPLTFLTASKDRFKRAEWTRWGSLGIGVVLFILLRGWQFINLGRVQDTDFPGLPLFYFLVFWFFFILIPLVLWKKSGVPFIKTPLFSILFPLFIFGPIILVLGLGVADRFYMGNLYEILVDQKYVSFFLLGWLGLIAFPTKGISRFALFPMFLLTAGFLVWQAPVPQPKEMDILRWVLVFFAGFGFESLRRDLLDPTWHGRLVWFLLGVCFFGGVV